MKSFMPTLSVPPRVTALFSTLAFACAVFVVPAIAAADEWQEMFNGKDLSGWVVDGASEYQVDGEKKPIWTVGEDGVIHCAGFGYGFLRWEQRVCDFHWHVEYRLQPGSNSGLGIRSEPYTGDLKTRPSVAGFEIQLLDDFGKPANKTSNGALYRYVAPKTNANREAGQWNTMEVECKGPHIRIWLNEELIHDLDQTKNKELANKPLCGYISLQNHVSPVDFRNVRIKDVTTSEK